MGFQSSLMVHPLTNIESASIRSEDLMSQVQGGDMGAFQELVRLYQRRVFRVISGYHRDPEDAMEVLQDTFLKVYTARETWERKTSFSAWLYRIAINASIDRFRRRDKKTTTSLDDVMESRIPSPPVSRGPLERLQLEERRKLLEGAIRRLPERQREVLALRYFGEMQLTEIAETLGCPLGTVKSNLHKAVRTLKELLTEKEEELSYEKL
jgi:RNA polymerase sigma-70 factor (ECF subfamily)